MKMRFKVRHCNASLKCNNHATTGRNVPVGAIFSVQSRSRDALCYVGPCHIKDDNQLVVGKTYRIFATDVTYWIVDEVPAVNTTPIVVKHGNASVNGVYGEKIPIGTIISFKSIRDGDKWCLLANNRENQGVSVNDCPVLPRLYVKYRITAITSHTWTLEEVVGEHDMARNVVMPVTDSFKVYGTAESRTLHVGETIFIVDEKYKGIFEPEVTRAEDKNGWIAWHGSQTTGLPRKGNWYLVTDNDGVRTHLALYTAGSPPAPTAHIDNIAESSASGPSAPREDTSMNGTVYTAHVIRTKTVAAGEGVTTGVQVSELVYTKNAFVAPSLQAASAIALAEAIVKLGKDLDVTDPTKPIEVKLSTPNAQ